MFWAALSRPQLTLWHADSAGLCGYTQQLSYTAPCCTVCRGTTALKGACTTAAHAHLTRLYQAAGRRSLVICFKLPQPLALKGKDVHALYCPAQCTMPCCKPSWRSLHCATCPCHPTGHHLFNKAFAV